MPVTNIGRLAFYNCSGLTSVTIGDTGRVKSMLNDSGCDVSYFTFVEDVGISSGGGTSAGGGPSSGNLFGDGLLEPGVVVGNLSYAKAQSASAPGVLCGADGSLAGAVQVSVGKKDRNNQVKVSASVTTMNGKAVKSKAVTVKLPEGRSAATCRTARCRFRWTLTPCLLSTPGSRFLTT